MNYNLALTITHGRFSMVLIKKAVLGLTAALVALTSVGVGALSGRNKVMAHHAPHHGLQGQVAQAPITQINIAFATRANTTELQAKADKVTALLSRELGMPIKATIADETASVEALRTNRTQVAFLSGRAALKAEQLAKARMYLAEVRSTYSGRYTYRSVMVVRKESLLGAKANPKLTLEQLRGRTIAFTSPTSGSGFVFPVAELVKQNLVPNRDRLEAFFSRVTYGNGYSGALQAVLRGQADVAAVSEYTLGAPYITAEEAQQLRVLYAISGVPAHGIVIDDSVPAPTREKLITALLKLNQPANNLLLRDLYNSTELVRVDHTRHLAPIRDALKRAGFEP